MAFDSESSSLTRRNGPKRAPNLAIETMIWLRNCRAGWFPPRATNSCFAPRMAQGEFPNLRLLVLGQGDLEQELVRLAEEL